MIASFLVGVVLGVVATAAVAGAARRMRRWFNRSDVVVVDVVETPRSRLSRLLLGG